jgi:hypothetical protein
MYEVVFERLRGSSLPILDLGCGIGILPYYLRQRGLQSRMIGVDWDAGRIAVAQQVAQAGFQNLSFIHQDARTPIQFQGHWRCSTSSTTSTTTTSADAGHGRRKHRARRRRGHSPMPARFQQPSQTDPRHGTLRARPALAQGEHRQLSHARDDCATIPRAMLFRRNPPDVGLDAVQQLSVRVSSA